MTFNSVDYCYTQSAQLNHQYNRLYDDDEPVSRLVGRWGMW